MTSDKWATPERHKPYLDRLQVMLDQKISGLTATSYGYGTAVDGNPHFGFGALDSVTEQRHAVKLAHEPDNNGPINYDLERVAELIIRWANYQRNELKAA